MVFTAKGTTHKEWLYESGYRLTLIDVVASQLQIETTNFAVCLDISQVFSHFIENVDRFPLSSPTSPSPPRFDLVVAFDTSILGQFIFALPHDISSLYICI